MRGPATSQLAVSVLGAVALHGMAFGLAAVALSRRPVERSAPAPVPVDVEVVEVAPKPLPVADATPDPVAAPAKVAAPVHHRARQAVAAREPAPATAPAAPAAPPSTAPAEGPGPAVPAPAVAAPAPGAATRPAAGVGARVPSAGAVVTAQPRYRTNPKPEYPLPSLRRHEEGTVVLDAVVGPDGLPRGISIRRSSGHPLLDRAALDVVRRWTFEPGRAAGAPVTSPAVVPVRFSLSGGP